MEQAPTLEPNNPQKLLLQTNPEPDSPVEADPWADAEVVDGELISDEQYQNLTEQKVTPRSGPEPKPRSHFMSREAVEDLLTPKPKSPEPAPSTAAEPKTEPVPVKPEDTVEKLKAHPTRVRFDSFEKDHIVVSALEFGASEKGKSIDWEAIPSANLPNAETVIETGSGKLIRVTGPDWNPNGNTVAQVISFNPDGSGADVKEYDLDADEKLPHAIGESWSVLQNELGDDPVVHILADPSNNSKEGGHLELLGEPRDGNPFYTARFHATDEFEKADPDLDHLPEHDDFDADEEDLAVLSDVELEDRGYGPKRRALIRALGEVDGYADDESLKDFLTSEGEGEDLDAILAAYKLHDSNLDSLPPLPTSAPKAKTKSRATKLAEKLKATTFRSGRALARASRSVAEITAYGIERYKEALETPHPGVEDQIEKQVRFGLEKSLKLGAYATNLSVRLRECVTANEEQRAPMKYEEVSEFLDRKDKLTPDEQEKFDSYFDYLASKRMGGDEPEKSA